MRNAPGARLVVKAVRVLVAQRMGMPVGEVPAESHLRPAAPAPRLVAPEGPALDPPPLALAAARAPWHPLVVVGVDAGHPPVAAGGVAAADRICCHDLPITRQRPPRN